MNHFPPVDNSLLPVHVSSSPALSSSSSSSSAGMKFKIGTTKVKIRASDLSGNVAKCAFVVLVKGTSFVRLSEHV